MHHLAIMNPKLKLLPKILSGEKTIESRWYKSRIAPWNRINKNDLIYFKNASQPVTLKAQVLKVLQFEQYTQPKLAQIITEYGGNPGICFVDQKKTLITKLREKNYCILIFLKHPQPVIPFYINKTGFGNACAWITLKDINQIRIQNKVRILNKKQ